MGHNLFSSRVSPRVMRHIFQGPNLLYRSHKRCSAWILIKGRILSEHYSHISSAVTVLLPFVSIFLHDTIRAPNKPRYWVTSLRHYSIWSPDAISTLSSSLWWNFSRGDFRLIALLVCGRNNHCILRWKWNHFSSLRPGKVILHGCPNHIVPDCNGVLERVPRNTRSLREQNSVSKKKKPKQLCRESKSKVKCVCVWWCSCSTMWRSHGGQLLE